MVVLAGLLLAQAGFVKRPFDQYSMQMVQGWRVYVSPDAKPMPEMAPALAMLDRQLKEITTLVPSRALSTLRTVPFFFEANDPAFPCACYHTSPEWLRQNGYFIQKTRSVQISNPKNFVDWIKLNQPYMTFHELAHAYHDIRFTFGHPEILAVYEAARASGKYENIAHNLGGTRRAYAMNNVTEYFAELSEAYFGRNDYYPFNREELRAFDPEGYAMIKKFWGVR